MYSVDCLVGVILWWCLLCAGMMRTELKDFVKGKAIPLKAWTGSEGSRRLRLPDFKTIGT